MKSLFNAYKIKKNIFLCTADIHAHFCDARLGLHRAIVQVEKVHSIGQRVKGQLDFCNSVFPGEVKMCLIFMNFRAPSSALKQKNYHNSPNMQPIIT